MSRWLKSLVLRKRQGYINSVASIHVAWPHILKSCVKLNLHKRKIICTNRTTACNNNNRSYVFVFNFCGFPTWNSLCSCDVLRYKHLESSYTRFMTIYRKQVIVSLQTFQHSNFTPEINLYPLQIAAKISMGEMHFYLPKEHNRFPYRNLGQTQTRQL